MVEGRAELLIKLLTLRFGPLSEQVRERIHTANLAELDLFAERVLTARSLDEVLGAN